MTGRSSLAIRNRALIGLMLDTGIRRAKARREVKKAIRNHGWHPIGHIGYENLRRQILSDRLTDHKLA